MVQEVGGFKEVWWARGGHAQTMIAYFLPSPTPLVADFSHNISLPDEDELVLLENYPVNAESETAKSVLLMHGLGGEADSTYMVRVAQKFLNAGWRVFRLNHRGAGAGDGKARYLYHAGRSEDVAAVIEYLAPIASAGLVAIGFSLSGNMLLKYAGETGVAVPSALDGVISVSAPVDLAICADALAAPANFLYDLRFVRMLNQAMAERVRRFPGTNYPMFDGRTGLRAFDDQVTAPFSGFGDADNYYTRCSAKQFIQDIRVQAHAICADNDPFLPVNAYDGIREHNNFSLQITRGGGHMGFLTDPRAASGLRWMDNALLARAMFMSGLASATDFSDPEYGSQNGNV